MRRIFVLALAALALLGVVTPDAFAQAPTPTFKINGIIDQVFSYSRNTSNYDGNLNVNDKLADKNGKLFDGMMGDGLHPTLKGYQVWADALKPLFTELLGSPAKTDHAPPPTGDPSARQ